MSEQFNIFMSQLSETNATLDYFTDFEKIKQKILHKATRKRNKYIRIKELENKFKFFYLSDISSETQYFQILQKA